jgi:hypothetical protein
MHAMHSYVSLDALQLHGSGLRPERGQQLPGAMDRQHLVGDVDLVGIRQSLHGRGVIHRLS